MRFLDPPETELVPRRTTEGDGFTPPPSRDSRRLSLVAALLLGTSCAAAAPLPEGNAFVRGLVGAQRQREEAVSLYTYDVTEVREQLGRNGRVRRRETHAYERSST